MASTKIFDSTEAILFLGTPHGGSPVASQAEIFRKIVSVIGFDAAHQNIRDLKPDSSILDAIRRDFQKLHQRARKESSINEAGRLRVYTFKESIGMTGIGFANLSDMASSICSSNRVGI
jgi:hypothetical protein